MNYLFMHFWLRLSITLKRKNGEILKISFMSILTLL